MYYYIYIYSRRGAERLIADEADMTPLDHAREREHLECVKILEEYGIRRLPSLASIASQVNVVVYIELHNSSS